MPDYFLPLLAILVAMLFLTSLSGILANYATKLAYILHISTNFIAILLLGFIGSLGEFSLAGAALAVNYNELVLGTAIGVTIAMTLLVGGISIIYHKGIATTAIINNKSILTLNFVILLFILLISDLTLSSTDGLLLIAAYLYYIIQLFSLKSDQQAANVNKVISRKQIIIAVIICILAFIGIFFTASFVIQQIQQIQTFVGLNLFVIAITLTSPFSVIPELYFELKMSKNGENRIALGDLITSSITNLTLISGLTALIMPITLTDAGLTYFNLFFLAIVILIFDIYAYTGKKFTLKEGYFMAAIYFVYLLLNFALIAV